jgi:hypothetical protein
MADRLTDQADAVHAERPPALEADGDGSAGNAENLVIDDDERLPVNVLSINLMQHVSDLDLLAAVC